MLPTVYRRYKKLENKKRLDLTGQTINSWKVIYYADNFFNTMTEAEVAKTKLHFGWFDRWFCECKCGKKLYKTTFQLKKGAKSCGCLMKEIGAHNGRMKLQKKEHERFLLRKDIDKVIGVRKGFLTPIRIVEKQLELGTKTTLLCECVCGKSKEVGIKYYLLFGGLSCGCSKDFFASQYGLGIDCNDLEVLKEREKQWRQLQKAKRQLKELSRAIKEM